MNTYPKNESAARSIKRYREIQQKERATVEISTELASQILFNHIANKDIEWSGFLFYRVIEGSIAKPSSLRIVADAMYLQDVGSAAYTSFDMTGEKILEMAETYPNFEDDSCRKGLIHTHHNMQCFFSGTDSDELQENADKHVFYLSLIVNHKGPWCAKIAVQAKLKTKGKSVESISRRDEITGEWIMITPQERDVDEEEDVLFLIDCDIEYQLPEFYLKNLEQIEQRKRRRVPTHTHNHNFPENFGNSSQGNLFDSTLAPPYLVATYVNAKNTLIAGLIAALKPKLYWSPQFDVTDLLEIPLNQRPSLGEMLVILDRTWKEKTKGKKKNEVNTIETTVIDNLATVLEEMIESTYGTGLPSDWLVKEVCVHMEHAITDVAAITNYKNLISKEVFDLIKTVVLAIRVQVDKKDFSKV